MNKTQRKDALKNIKKQLVSWLSIIVISSFAVAAYLGLTYSARALENAGKEFYTSTNFRDIQITSNCLLSDEDLSAIKALEGVTDAEGIYRVNGKITSNYTTTNIQISSLSEQIGTPVLKSGRLPQTESECIIETNLAAKHHLNIGAVISPLDTYDEEIPELHIDEYKITGTFVHAEHSSFDLDETYCMLVTADAFDHERLDNCYSLVELTFSQPNYRSFFSKEYDVLSDSYVTKLEGLGKLRSQSRYEDHLQFLADQIADTEDELKDAKSQLDFASRTVTSLKGKTGDIMADLSNMLSVVITEDPSEYKTADEQVSDYEETLISYNNAVKKVEEARKRYNKLTSRGECVWYVFNRNASIDYVNLRTNSENLGNLNSTFSLLFVFIAVMVIFASLSRMVYEQRNLVGISKALGMHFKEVLSKYLIFGLSAAVLGIVAGIILSLYVIEFIIAVGYEDHFVFGRFPFFLDSFSTIMAIIIAFVTAVIAVYISCAGLLKQTAKELLSPAVPHGQNSSLKNSSLLKKLSLYNRLILLNIRSDLVRVCVTILSVAGCCALIVIGFSLRYSIAGCLSRQMSDFTHYDGIININPALVEDASDNMASILNKNKIENLLFLHKHGSVQIDDTIEYAEFIISDDLEGVSNFHPLIDFKNKSQLTSYETDGIIITNRLAELYKLNKGDNIYLVDDMGYKHEVTIEGIIKNYLGRYIFLTKNYYESVMNDTYKDNAFFVRGTTFSLAHGLPQILEDTEGFESYSSSDESYNLFDGLLIVLNMIVFLMIALSGVMSMFVLLNLANMYLMSKRTELLVMRINGFTVKETVRYAIREVIFTTILGIIVGMLFGVLINYTILRKMEQVHLMFVREPNIPSCIFGAVITAAFTFGIYGFAMRNIKTLSLKDSLT